LNFPTEPIYRYFIWLKDCPGKLIHFDAIALHESCAVHPVALCYAA